MKKQLLLASIFLLFTTFTFAQLENVKATKSDIFKDKKKRTGLSFAEDDGNGGLITFRGFYGGMTGILEGYYIEHFDSNLNLIKESELEIEHTFNIENSIRGVIVDNGEIRLLEYKHDKKTKKHEFNVLTSSLKSLSFKKKSLISLGKEEIKKFFGMEFVFGLGQYDSNAIGEVSFSKNKNFIAINFDIKNKNQETHRIFVFNKKLEKIGVYEFKKDIKDKLFTYENVDVDDNDGSVYLLGKAYENNSRKSKKEGKTNYHYELYKLSTNGQKKVSFKTDENFVSSLTTIKSGDKLSCVGFYGEKVDWKYKGVCRFDMNIETLEIENKSFNKFSDQFMTDKYGNKERKKKKELDDISYRGIFMDDSGIIYMNAEEFYIDYLTSIDANGRSRIRTVYHYDDIISTKIGTNGDLLWARNINKSQTGAGSSYTSTVKDDEVYFFINCSDKINRKGNNIVFKDIRMKKSNLYAIKINKKGDFSYQSIVNDEDSEVSFWANKGISSQDKNNIIFPGSKKKKKQLLKISI